MFYLKNAIPNFRINFLNFSIVPITSNFVLVEIIVYRKRWFRKLFLNVFGSQLMLSSTWTCTTNVLSSLFTVEILHVNIAYINMMLNIIKSFLHNEYFWLGDQKKRFGLFAQSWSCWLKQWQTKDCALSILKDLHKKIQQ